MKTTDPRDPLDQQIDALLASRPAQPSTDFLQRVCTAAEQTPAQHQQPAKAKNLLRFALPTLAAAAAIAIAAISFTALQPEPPHTTQLSQTNSPSTPTTTIDTSDTTSTELAANDQLESIDDQLTQDIFRLQEALASIHLTEETTFNSNELHDTLDVLLLGFES